MNSAQKRHTAPRRANRVCNYDVSDMPGEKIYSGINTFVPAFSLYREVNGEEQEVDNSDNKVFTQSALKFSDDEEGDYEDYTETTFAAGWYRITLTGNQNNGYRGSFNKLFEVLDRYSLHNYNVSLKYDLWSDNIPDLPEVILEDENANNTLSTDCYRVTNWCTVKSDEDADYIYKKCDKPSSGTSGRYGLRIEALGQYSGINHINFWIKDVNDLSDYSGKVAGEINTSSSTADAAKSLKVYRTLNEIEESIDSSKYVVDTSWYKKWRLRFRES